MTKDLTSGSPLRAIISFSVPVLFGNLFQQLYNMTDSAIVGQFVGVNALAGVGATGSINFLIIGFVVGVCAGFSVPISQCFGAGDYDGLRRCFTNSIWLAGGFSVILTILTLVFLDPILIIMQTPSDIYEYAKVYIGTIFAGISGIFLYNLLASVMRALGDSRTPVVFLFFASVLNVGLDLLFVLVFHMGVFGAGLATVISQTVSGVLCILLMLKKFTVLASTKEQWKPSPEHMKRLLTIGVPMGLQFSITAIGSIVLQGAINGLGSMYVAAVTSAIRIHTVFTQGLETLGLAMATFTGQNLGAGKIDRIRKGVLQCNLVGIGYSLFCFVVLLFIGPSLALIFVTPDKTEIISVIQYFLLANSGSYILLSSLLILRNCIQGAGYSGFAMISGVFEMFARALVGLGLVSLIGFPAVAFANTTAWVAANLFLIPAFFTVIKRLQQKAAIEHRSV